MNRVTLWHLISFYNLTVNLILGPESMRLRGRDDMTRDFPLKPARFCKPPGVWVQSSKPCTPQFGGPWMSALSSTWARGMCILRRKAWVRPHIHTSPSFFEVQKPKDGWLVLGRVEDIRTCMPLIATAFLKHFKVVKPL